VTAPASPGAIAEVNTFPRMLGRNATAQATRTAHATPSRPVDRRNATRSAVAVAVPWPKRKVTTLSFTAW